MILFFKHIDGYFIVCDHINNNKQIGFIIRNRMSNNTFYMVSKVSDSSIYRVSMLSKHLTLNTKINVYMQFAQNTVDTIKRCSDRLPNMINRVSDSSFDMFSKRSRHLNYVTLAAEHVMRIQ